MRFTLTALLCLKVTAYEFVPGGYEVKIQHVKERQAFPRSYTKPTTRTPIVCRGTLFWPEALPR